MSDKLESREDNVGVRLNQVWFETPTDWNCPVCKRHKTELPRPDKSGGLYASLEDYHDHIHAFVNNLSKGVIASDRADVPIDDDEYRFINHRILPLLERFRDLVHAIAD